MISYDILQNLENNCFELLNATTGMISGSNEKSMINKYMALATVNIIACKANEIQSLETLKLPINVDWKNLPHKYIVVITNSYGLGTISLQIKSQG